MKKNHVVLQNCWSPWDHSAIRGIPSSAVPISSPRRVGCSRFARSDSPCWQPVERTSNRSILDQARYWQYGSLGCLSRIDWFDSPGCFAIDVLGFAVMSNHFHVILRNRPDIVDGWSDTEVARRWWMLCPGRKTDDGQPEQPTQAELDAIRSDLQRLAELRGRLSDISRFMRMVAEPIARLANAEDQCPGRFWQGRFKAVKLCDEAALLTCSVYVDLNPLRAGCCQTPESSEHTSARLRIDLLQTTSEQVAGDVGTRGNCSGDWLAPSKLDEAGTPGPQPSVLPTRASDKGFLPMGVEDYLDLLDWTGWQTAAGKTGTIPAHLAPVFQRFP